MIADSPANYGYRARAQSGSKLRHEKLPSASSELQLLHRIASLR